MIINKSPTFFNPRHFPSAFDILPATLDKSLYSKTAIRLKRTQNVSLLHAKQMANHWRSIEPRSIAAMHKRYAETKQNKQKTQGETLAHCRTWHE